MSRSSGSRLPGAGWPGGGGAPVLLLIGGTPCPGGCGGGRTGGAIWNLGLMVTCSVGKAGAGGEAADAGPLAAGRDAGGCAGAAGAELLALVLDAPGVGYGTCKGLTSKLLMAPIVGYIVAGGRLRAEATAVPVRGPGHGYNHYFTNSMPQ